MRTDLGPDLPTRTRYAGISLLAPRRPTMPRTSQFQVITWDEIGASEAVELIGHSKFGDTPS